MLNELTKSTFLYAGEAFGAFISQREDEQFMSKAAQTASDIRRFNRFYLPFFHLLTQKYLNSEYSVAEARILYEIYDYGKISARDIVKTLCIDKGYLSRMLKKFEAGGIVKREESGEDSRLSEISLTAKGKSLTERLAAESNLQVEKELAGISDDDLEKLSCHMAEIIKILGGGRDGDH